MVDLDRDDPMAEAVEIAMTMANCCFNGVDMVAGTSLMGEYFWNDQILFTQQVTNYLVASTKTNVTERP